MLLFLWQCALITVDTLCGFLQGSVHLHFHDLQHVERYPLVFHISNICFPFCPLSLSLFSLLFIWVCPLSFLPLSFPDIVLVLSSPPPVQSPLLSLSSSKWVFGCQCQSVGGGDESVAPTVSLATTISAHCHVSVGATFSTLCTIDLSSHHYMSQQFVNMMGDGLSIKKCLLIPGHVTFLLSHIYALRKLICVCWNMPMSCWYIEWVDLPEFWNFQKIEELMHICSALKC